jgi:hypothetical protein
MAALASILHIWDMEFVAWGIHIVNNGEDRY